MRLFVVFVLLSFSSSAQGAWDIDYVVIDSVDETLLDRSIGLDFRNYDATNSKESGRSVRFYVSSEDTNYIERDSSKMSVLEKRSIYCDHGVFREQFVEIRDLERNKVELIGESKLLSIEEDRLKVEMEILSKSRDNRKKYKPIRVDVIWVEKSKLDGLMIKRKK